MYIVVIACASASLTSLICWLIGMRHRQIGWHIALFGALGIAGSASFVDNGIILFDPAQWSQNKRSLEGLLIVFALQTGIEIVPALFIVGHYRREFKTQENFIRK
jgi:hypothetical protein